MHKRDITAGYACLECRKAFKKHVYDQDQRGNWEPVEYDVVCPQCCRAMFKTGPAFKAPKTTDLKSWRELRPIFESGYQFFPGFGRSAEDQLPGSTPIPSVRTSEFNKPARKRRRTAVATSNQD